MTSGHRPTLKPGRVPDRPGPPPSGPAGASPNPETAAITAVAEALITEVRRIADALEPATFELVGHEQTTGDGVVRDELWSLLDWSFWGAGIGDVLREAMADVMTAAITPEQRADALRVMAAWEASGREPVGRRAYEELKAERDRLSDQLTATKGERDAAHSRADGYANDIDRLRDEIQTADRIRAEAQRDRDQHAAVLSEVLATFVHETHPGYRALQSQHVKAGRVEQWRSVVAPTVERPWWEHVATMRHELEVANDVTARTKELLARRTATLRTRAEQAEDLLRVAYETSNRSETVRARAVLRAEQAEAAIERMREVLADPNHSNMVLASTVRAALDGPTTKYRTCGECGGIVPQLDMVLHMREQHPTTDDEQPTPSSDSPARVVAYRSCGGAILRCLAHKPEQEGIDSGDFVAVTSEELPDGGVCTWPIGIGVTCGVDVLITPRAD